MRAQEKDIWLKAAAAGSLWASIEIVIGSFLHNLRIPMAGTILAAMGISLLIGFQYQWKDRGLIWRAGLICALMKSLSPSAVILGPMVGIMTEALILEWSVRAFGRKPLGFLVGAVLAIFSALLHKVGTLLVLYGLDLVTILENMYRFAENQLRFKGPPPFHLLVYLMLIYFGLGLLTGILGIRAGRQLEQAGTGTDGEIPFQPFTAMDVTGNQKYSPMLLYLHVLILVAILFLMNDLPVYYPLALLVPYTGFIIYRYPDVFRRFSRPLFWIQLMVILFLAVLFWNGLSGGSVWDPEGLLVGLKMILRAFIVVLVFSAISAELRNPLIRAILFKQGFGHFYAALGMAFSVLPGIMERMTRPAHLLIRPVQSLTVILKQSESILDQFIKQLHKQVPVYIITGDQREGKTTFLEETVELLKKNGFQVAGIMASGLDKAGERVGFHLVDITSGRQRLLCSTTEKPGWPNIGKFYFDPDVILFGETLLLSIDHTHILVVDEVGPLEMNGGGWDASLKKLVQKHRAPMIWVVRRSLAEQVIRRYQLVNVIILDINKVAPVGVASMIDKNGP